MTLDLLDVKHRQRRSLAQILRSQSRDLSALRRRGFVGEASEEAAAESSVTFGKEFTGSNQISYTTNGGNPSILTMPDNSALVRRADDLTTTSAAAGQLMRRTATSGVLGFAAATGLLTVAPGLLYTLALSADDFGGSTTTYTISGSSITGWFAESSGPAYDATVQLPSPTLSGRFIFIGDPLGVIDATHRYKLTSSALNGINGSSSFPSSGWITATNSLLLLTYSGSAAGWSCRTLI